MLESKRLLFLKSYLKLFGVEKIDLIKETADFINGIAIYDENDPEESQEFVWHKTEKDVPSAQLNNLIDKIAMNKWHNGDKISTQIEEMEFDEFDNITRDKILEELFDVSIRMVDNGQETDSYFVHY